MAAQIGYFDTLKSVAGKVFSYLASITLTGTDGKTITCTQDTSLDEAVAMSSKAPKAQEAWIAPSLENSWVNFGGGYTVAGYYKDAFGVVHLKGMVKDGTSLNAVIFTLPAGYRPSEIMGFSGVSNDVWTGITVQTDGSVAVSEATGSTAFVGINGISFRV